MGYDDWKATDRSDPFREMERHNPLDELHQALEELEQTGIEIRAERDRLTLEVAALRQARVIVERGASEELWRWRFVWFWGVVAHVAVAHQMFPLVSRALSHCGCATHDDLDTVETLILTWVTTWES